MSLAIDLYYAVMPKSDVKVDNYTCQLFRLMLKADCSDFRRLQTVYPLEAKMVQLHHQHAVYSGGHDTTYGYYEKIQELAETTLEIPPGQETEFVIGNL